MKIPNFALAVAVAAIAAVTPASAVVYDYKSVHGSQCVAGGENTTATELSYGSFGVSNPGITDEMVICPIPIDIESQWLTTQTNPTQMIVRYRTGSVPGRIICTTYSGSIAAQEGAVTSITSTSNMQPANSITNELGVSPPKPNWGYTTPPVPPVSVACVLGPKTKIGAIYFVELKATHQP
jgi:hypothetical protein